MLIPKRTTPKDLLKVCKKLLKAKKKVKKVRRLPIKWPANDKDSQLLKKAEKAQFDLNMENQKKYQNSKM